MAYVTGLWECFLRAAGALQAPQGQAHEHRINFPQFFGGAKEVGEARYSRRTKMLR